MQLEVNNISFGYNKSAPKILNNISFKINSDERVALIGSSGYGKSTLAKIIAGYLKQDSGEVLWNKKALPKDCHNLLKHLAKILS